MDKLKSKASHFGIELEIEMTVANHKSLGRENIVGSCLMILSMAAFAGEDSIIKALSKSCRLAK